MTSLPLTEMAAFVATAAAVLTDAPLEFVAQNLNPLNGLQNHAPAAFSFVAPLLLASP